MILKTKNHLGEGEGRGGGRRGKTIELRRKRRRENHRIEGGGGGKTIELREDRFPKFYFLFPFWLKSLFQTFC